MQLNIQNLLRKSLKFSSGLIGLLALLVTLQSIPNIARAYPDPVFPFPLTTPLPFPWDTIQGIWQARVNGQLALFSFSVQDDSNGRKSLRVQELSSNADSVIAEGSGFIDEKTKTVRAGMVGKEGAYMLFVGLYKVEEDRELTVLTMRKFQDQKDGLSTMIEKVVGQPYAGPKTKTP